MSPGRYALPALAALLASGIGCGGKAAPPRSGAVPQDGTGGLALPASLCGTPAPPFAWPGPVQVVGTGTPGSCTEAALEAALAQGGVITFDCGPDPVTLFVSSEKRITRDTWLDGGGLVTLSGGGVTRILAIHGSFERAGPNLRVERLAFRDGRASGTAIPLGTDVDGGGGAIFHLGGTVTVVECRFLDNAAATWGPDVAGGAISGIGNPASTAVHRSAFRGNRAANGVPDSGAGAAYLQGSRVTITGSTVSRNRAAGSPGLRFHDHGAAQARADLTNVTIVENAVYDRADPNANGLGGGLWTADVDGTIANCTIARNRAGFAAGILGLSGLTIVNSVIANEAANAYVNGNCHDFTPGAKAAGARVLQQADPGQVRDGDCLAGGVTRGDPRLGPLGLHGGPTETAVPGAGSQALGAGASCPATDQRGVARPAACTLGAVEPP